MDETTAPTPAPKVSLIAKVKNLSKKTKLIIAATTAVLLGGGGAAAFAVYQSPDVVVGMAIGSLFSEANPSFEVGMDLNTAGFSGSGIMQIYTSDKGSAVSLYAETKVAEQPVGATLNLTADKAGNLYLNLDNFDSLAYYLVSNGFMPEATITAAREALLGTWVKVTKEDLDSVSGESNCISDKLDDPEYAKKVSAELTGLIRANNFIAIKKELPQFEGDRVFELGGDAAKMRSFLTGFTKSAFYKDVNSCTPTFEMTAEQIDTITQEELDKAMNTTKVTIYANAFSHKFSKMSIEMKDTGSGESFKVSMKSNGSLPNMVVIPAKTVSMEEILSTLASAGTE